MYSSQEQMFTSKKNSEILEFNFFSEYYSLLVMGRSIISGVGGGVGAVKKKHSVMPDCHCFQITIFQLQSPTLQTILHMDILYTYHTPFIYLLFRWGGVGGEDL